MRDEHLTLLDIMERDIPHAEFRILICLSYRPGLQFSGSRASLARCGKVNDAVAKHHVVEAFYKYMFMDLKDGAGSVMDCYEGGLGPQPCYTCGEDERLPLEQRM
ncbi:uncharacterized protein BJ212DRAFT_1413016, partial [Suillus subaureus]